MNPYGDIQDDQEFFSLVELAVRQAGGHVVVPENEETRKLLFCDPAISYRSAKTVELKLTPLDQRKRSVEVFRTVIYYRAHMILKYLIWKAPDHWLEVRLEEAPPTSQLVFGLHEGGLMASLDKSRISTDSGVRFHILREGKMSLIDLTPVNTRPI